MNYSDHEAWLVRQLEALQSKLAAAEAELERERGWWKQAIRDAMYHQDADDLIALYDDRQAAEGQADD